MITEPFSPWALASVTAQREAADREHRRLKRPPQVGPWRQDQEGGAVFSLAHELTIEIIDALASMLDETGAVNRVSIKSFHPKAGAIECTVQRVGRLTPEDARIAAEAALRRAVTMLRERGGEWAEPLAFPPSEPPTIDGEGTDTRHPWIKFDFRSRPNLFRCERCGGVQQIPDQTDTQVWSAMCEAFGKGHAECQEGDSKP